MKSIVRWDEYMTLNELCFHLRNRRRMYLLDDRFSTAVAFVEGYNSAFDGVPLRGFNQFVAERTVGRYANTAWGYLVASTLLPEVLGPKMRIDDIPAELGPELTERMLDLLEEFAGRTQDGGNEPPATGRTVAEHGNPA